MTVDCTDICATQCSPPKNSNSIPICNSLFIFEAAPENRQYLLAHTCDACDIFEFRFAHYNKLPEHVIDLFLLLLILLFCMMQRVIRKSEKRNKAGGRGGKTQLTALYGFHTQSHSLYAPYLSMCVCIGVSSAGVIRDTCYLLIWFTFSLIWNRIQIHIRIRILILIVNLIQPDAASHRIASRFHFDGKQIYVQLKGSNTDWKLTDKCVCIFIVAIICLPWVAEWERWGEERRGEGEVVSAGALFVCQSRATIAQQLV